MPDPVTFTSTTARFDLPLLHTAQAQKEFFVNEAFARTDALLHCTVLGEIPVPPPSPAEGDCWLVASEPAGEWVERAGHLALWQGGAWVFIPPRDGLRLFNRARAQEMLFFGFWRKASTPVEPLGGSSVDGEARAAINDLVSALQALGILPSA